MSDTEEKRSSRGGNNNNTNTKQDDRSRRPTICIRNFKGACKWIEDSVFDCTGPGQADLCANAHKETAEHAGREFDHAADIGLALLNCKDPTVKKPEAPMKAENKTDATDELVWKKEADEHVKRKSKLENNKNRFFSIVWGQFADCLKNKVESADGHQSMHDTLDAFSLLKTIESMMCDFKEQKHAMCSLCMAKRNFHLLQQGRNMSTGKHCETFDNTVDVIEQHGATTMDDMLLTHDKEHQDTSAPGGDDAKKAQSRAKEKLLACAFLHGSDKERHGGLVTESENDCAKKDNRCPETSRAACDLLVNHKQQRGTRGGFSAGKRPTVSFHDDGESNIKRFNCGKMGHHANECPDKDKENETGQNHFAEGTEDEGTEDEDKVCFSF